MAPWSRSSLAGPLNVSYPIKAPPAHAFQLQDEIYCPEAGLIQQDAADTQQHEGGGDKQQQGQSLWKVDKKTIQSERGR